MTLKPDQVNDPATQQGMNMDLGSLIANATIGVQRNPDLPLGTHICDIISTQRPTNAMAFVAELQVGKNKHRYYKPIDGKDAKTVAARMGEVLGFICAAAGYHNLKEFEEAGYDKQKRAALCNKCLGAGPGPLQGRKIQITVTDSGKTTRPNAQGNTYPIHNYSFAPVE
jgi:hypothetical protein